ncbi:MAG: DNA-processing protein DprA [Lautropia sp.]
MHASDRPDPEELAAWLRLAATSGIGPAVGRRLLSVFGLPIDVFAADAASIAAACGTPAVAQALHRPDPQRESRVERSLAWLAGAADVPRSVITLADPRYPPRLLHLADPPLLLHVEGSVQALSRRAIAIVGSRNATAVGASTARDLAAALAGAGWCIVSGLAEGIDRSAHLGALDAGTHAAGTVAVMGTGIDRIYPSRHQALAREIARNGALVSEQAVGTEPRPGCFPRRNRLIAALSHGVLVVEAALRSGSLITARVAAELGRDVFAVPGSIHSPQARGCHRLIRQGAVLTETLDDIVSEFSLSIPCGIECAPSIPSGGTRDGYDDGRRSRAGLAPPLRALLDALDGGPSRVDALQRVLGWPVGSLLAALQTLELDGWLGAAADGTWYVVR